MIFGKKKQPQTFSNKDNDKLELVYTDIFNNKYYQFKPQFIIEIPRIRTIVAEEKLRYIEMYLTKDELKRLMLEMENDLTAVINAALKGVESDNNSRLSNVFGIINEIKFRLNFLSEENTMLDLSTCYFFLENENPKIIDDNLINKKLECWKKDYNAKDFFLRSAIPYIQKFTNCSADDILNYLKENKQFSERIKKHLHIEL